ncbi:alveolin domain containing intermediate filament IMC9 [Besnoitia besnoiti]|uniref:Alveolin domain containing intermediate filament IMC9 n=1 Tax=Besnoitia besnoiti TaxID=94643 RepID=A0A2A9MD70_BESBE|nr:alveolin domain containing intermediate filament IMC9 [Besnoitia besnoiti]PFH35154.1 alveolin domain containing intermediate filament IMC9 [Besnoitia besnoiti]
MEDAASLASLSLQSPAGVPPMLRHCPSAEMSLSQSSGPASPPRLGGELRARTGPPSVSSTVAVSRRPTESQTSPLSAPYAEPSLTSLFPSPSSDFLSPVLQPAAHPPAVRGLRLQGTTSSAHSRQASNGTRRLGLEPQACPSLAPAHAKREPFVGALDTRALSSRGDAARSQNPRPEQGTGAPHAPAPRPASPLSSRFTSCLPEKKALAAPANELPLAPHATLAHASQPLPSLSGFTAAAPSPSSEAFAGFAAPSLASILAAPGPGAGATAGFAAGLSRASGGAVVRAEAERDLRGGRAEREQRAALPAGAHCRGHELISTQDAPSTQRPAAAASSLSCASACCGSQSDDDASARDVALVTSQSGERLAGDAALAVGSSRSASPLLRSSRQLDALSQVYIPDSLRCEPQVVEKVITVPRVIYEEKITEVPQVVMRERVVEVPQVVRKEKVVQVPKIEVKEKIVEVPVVKYVDKVVEVPHCVVEQKIVSVDEVIRQEKIVHVPKIEVVERIIKTPKIVQVEKIIEVPRIEYREVEVEKIVEVPKVEIKYVEREVPVPQKVIRHVPVDKIVHVRQKKFVEKIVKVPVPRYIEVPKYIEQPVPREKFVRVEKKIERKVPTPQPQETYQEVEKPIYVTKYIERPVPVPTERIVEEHVPVEVPREVVVEKPYDVVRRVEKPVEVAVPFVSGDPLILTPAGYVPFQEFARKTQALTPQEKLFYERQSESFLNRISSSGAATLSPRPPAMSVRPTTVSPRPTTAVATGPGPQPAAPGGPPSGVVESSRGDQAWHPHSVTPGFAPPVAALSQASQQSAYPFSPLNSPSGYSGSQPHPSQRVD